MSVPHDTSSPCKGEAGRGSGESLSSRQQTPSLTLPLAGGGSGAASKSPPLEKGRVREGLQAAQFTRTPAMTKHARRLRTDMTEVEKRLWWKLRREQMGGLNFRRQHPLGPYVLDFYCPSIQLAIELDGGQHNEPVAQIRDERRTRLLNAKGVTVLRFWNNDVMSNMDGVLQEIMRISESLVLRRQSPSLTLPLAGGGNQQALDIVVGEVDR